MMASQDQVDVCVHRKKWLCLFWFVLYNPEGITSAHLANNLQCTTANKYTAFIFPKLNLTSSHSFHIILDS